MGGVESFFYEFCLTIKKKIVSLHKISIFIVYNIKKELMKRIYPTLSMILLLGLQATPTFAQNDDFVKQFQQARQGMMDDYNKFRNTILTDYDKYMQGAWKEY